MILRRGEHFILQDRAAFVQGASGILSLTNYRIVFETQGPTPLTAYEQAIDGVGNVHIGAVRESGSYRQVLTIEGTRGRVAFYVSGAGVWAESIVNANARAAPPPPPYIPPPPPGYVAPGQVVVNVPAQEPPKIMMHCRNCGNLYDATKGRCDKCGAPPT
jgi:hypothetical protein